METVGNFINHVLFRAVKKNGGIFFADIFLKWRDVVGEYFATQFAPLKIICDDDSKILHLKIIDHDNFEKFEFHNKILIENILIQRINFFFGNKSLVSKIIFSAL